jgi:hypothetical protein
MTVPSQRELKMNKTLRILKDAEDGGYGVVASIVYANGRYRLGPIYANHLVATTSSRSWLS